MRQGKWAKITFPVGGRDLYFDFPNLIAHATKTRSLGAGTIIGSGTVSNEDHATVGSSCLAEQRMIETIEQGEPKTNFMAVGDRIRIEMLDAQGASIFGAIDQEVVPAGFRSLFKRGPKKRLIICEKTNMF